MSRKSRIISSTGFYHLMLRGVNRADLFHDDQDRGYFLKLLFQYAEKTGADIVTYCLMTNHVHILIISQDPGALVRKMASGYVYYFNHKYERVGHLFHERFKSEPIEEEQYLLTVFRYILRNPEKAGICPTGEYRWSGFSDLTVFNNKCNFKLVSEIAGGIQNLVRFILTDNSDICMDWDEPDQWTDKQIAEFLKALSNTENAHHIKSLPADLRNQYIVSAYHQGISVTKLARVIGLSNNTIRSILRKHN